MTPPHAPRVALATAVLACGFALVACSGATTTSTDATDPGALGDDAGAEAGDAAAPAAPALVAVPLALCTPNLAYSVSVSVGTQAFDLTLDTGSTSLGVASSACSGCDVKPKYTPGATANDEKQQAVATYGTGSWTGEIYTDTVAVGASPAAPVKLAAIQDQTDFFAPITCGSKSGGVQGILGLGPAGSALKGTVGFLDALHAAHPEHADVFATRLCESGGTLWLGGYDPAATTAPPAYTPMSADRASALYVVNLASMEIAGTTTPIATSQYADAIVDTGSSVFAIPVAARDALASALDANPAFTQTFGSAATFFSSPTSCRTVAKTKAELDAALPPLTLHFGSSPSIAVQALPTESYLIAYGTKWCTALYAMDPSAQLPLAAILGAPIMRSNVVIFDRAAKRIGFAPHAPCP